MKILNPPVKKENSFFSFCCIFYSRETKNRGKKKMSSSFSPATSSSATDSSVGSDSLASSSAESSSFASPASSESVVGRRGRSSVRFGGTPFNDSLPMAEVVRKREPRGESRLKHGPLPQRKPREGTASGRSIHTWCWFSQNLLDSLNSNKMYCTASFADLMAREIIYVNTHYVNNRDISYIYVKEKSKMSKTSEYPGGQAEYQAIRNEAGYTIGFRKVSEIIRNPECPLFPDMYMADDPESIFGGEIGGPLGDIQMDQEEKAPLSYVDDDEVPEFDWGKGPKRDLPKYPYFS